MDESVDNHEINLIDNYSVLINENINEMLRKINTKITIMHFNDNFSLEDKILNVIENELIEKIIIVSRRQKKINNKKIIFESNINARVIKKVTQNIIIFAISAFNHGEESHS